MKTYALLLTFLFVAQNAKAQATNANPETLVQALTSFKWTWENFDSKGKHTEEIQFYQGGFAQNAQFFTATWRITGLRTVELTNNNSKTPNAHKKAYLTFDKDFQRYEGVDFNAKSKIQGVRAEKVDPARSAPKP